MIRNKYIIMKALQMTELQYGEMVMHYANLWMERYFGTEECIINALNYSPSFWKWWVRQWDNRDEHFIHTSGLSTITAPLDVTNRLLTKRLYEKHHNVDELNIVPNNTVVKEVGKLVIIESKKLKQLKAQ